MPIINDREYACVRCTETGDYMTWALADWQSQSQYFMLHDKYERCVLGTLVRMTGFDETGRNGGLSTFVRYNLDHAWIPSGKKQPPKYFYGPHKLIDRLSEFLEVYRHYSGVKDPDPRFEFSDERGDGESK